MNEKENAELLIGLIDIDRLSRIRKYITNTYNEGVLMHTRMCEYLTSKDVQFLVRSRVVSGVGAGFIANDDSDEYNVVVAAICLYYPEFTEEYYQLITKANIRDNSELWELGIAYGYPECCIEYFTENVMDPSWDEYIKTTPMLGTGYIPCPKCKDKSIHEHVAGIDSRRDQKQYPFPIEADSLGELSGSSPFNNDIERMDYIETLIKITNLEQRITEC